MLGFNIVDLICWGWLFRCCLRFGIGCWFSLDGGLTCVLVCGCGAVVLYDVGQGCLARVAFLGCNLGVTGLVLGWVGVCVPLQFRVGRGLI